MNPPDRLLKILGRLGRGEFLLRDDDRIYLSDEKRFAANGGDGWASACAGLPLEGHLDVLRGLVLAESREGWGGGSVSPISTVFDAIERRVGWADAFHLARWIIDNSVNEYIPFNGSIRAYFWHVTPEDAWRFSTVSEAVRWHRDSISQAKSTAKSARDADRKAVRIEKRAVAAREHAARKQALELRRLQLVERGLGAPPAERLGLVLENPEVPLAVFPVEWAQVTPEESRLLSGETLTKLLDRLAPQKRGPWASLRRRLERCMAHD